MVTRIAVRKFLTPDQVTFSVHVHVCYKKHKLLNTSSASKSVSRSGNFHTQKYYVLKFDPWNIEHGDQHSNYCARETFACIVFIAARDQWKHFNGKNT